MDADRDPITKRGLTPTLREPVTMRELWLSLILFARPESPYAHKRLRRTP